MKKMSLPLRWLLLIFAFTAIAACQRGPEAARKDYAEALKAEGYAAAPVITAVAQGGPGTLVITGQAQPDGRVRVLYGQQRAIGVTADASGRFTAELPAGPEGSVYDLSTEDNGRLIHAEGRLFVPPGQPAKAVLLRPGTSSLPVAPQGLGIAIVDYDSAGALGITGRVGPKAALDVLVDGEIRAQPTARADGVFTAMTQIAPPGVEARTVSLSADAASTSWKRDVAVTKPGAGDRVTPIPEGWRIDWTLPGGGTQTTLVF
ncbi:MULTISPECIES: hypothetical protein [Asticcacaulis]|uniref:hypothetical protein n=1 Tax=Asticcacaulis TaxID=76890 RepID=UPI001AEA0AA8|nr:MULTISPECIES: hypothetical protein [Asticcacaulis]MBP2158510.1 hypothetical protein [Asticcacaulis solisilvae]MDR6799556.1 hypothetical protein [Asticcacaulis sp. BE141]